MRFISFNTKSESGGITLSWKTILEQHSNYYIIEKSGDVTSWKQLIRLPAIGCSTKENHYTFTDPNCYEHSFYRVVEYNLAGDAWYSSVLYAVCDNARIVKISPNPFHDFIYVDIVTGIESFAMISVFDNKGIIVKAQKTALIKGRNQIYVETKLLDSGLYRISVKWDRLNIHKMIQIIKV